MRESIVRRLQELVAQSLAGEERIVLAISGGVDSMVLLDAAAAVLTPDRLWVATFDHGTGPAATEAAALVGDRSAALGFPCVSGAARASDSLRSEAALREARWRFLHSVAGSRSARVATAHTLDDQIETVLMRVLRGAGARGIAGLFASSDALRPLLRVRRHDVLRYAQRRRLTWMEDPSNASLRYLRNRVRHQLLPALRRARPELDRELVDIAQTAALWRADVQRYVDRAIAPRAWTTRRKAVDVDARELTSLGASELATVWPEIAARAGLALDRRGTERLAEFTRTAKVGRRVQLSGGWEVVRSRDAFQLRASELSPPLEVSLDRAGGTSWDRWDFRPIREPARDAWSTWLPGDALLVIRSWRPGDVMRLKAGDHGQARKVKYFLSDAGITGHERARWPVVLADDEVIWIPGVRRSAVATARSGRPALAFACEYTSR